MSADVRVEADCELDEIALVAMADRILEVLDLADAELSVLVTSDAHMAELNETYRGVEGATDVLSFSQEAMPSGAPRVLGDVVIGVGRATQQAAEMGHSLRHELWVLLTHGVLHLLGHDHHTDAEREVMASKERDVLDRIREGPQVGLVGRSDEG